MPRLEWTDDLATGNVRVDAQHRQLIRFANLFFEAVAAGKEANILAEAFAMLATYIGEHFRDEEIFFRRMRARRLDDQRVEHVRLENEFQAIHAAWRAKGFAADRETVDSVKRWIETRLLPHMVFDRQVIAEGPGTPRG